MWRTYPFRLFFPLTALAIWLAVLPWLTLLFAPQHATFPLHFHALAFIHVVAGAAFIGFLFTALPSWTKFPLRLERHSLNLLLLWLLVTFSLPYLSLTRWLAVLMWGYLSALVVYWVWQAKKTQLLSFAVMLLMLTSFALRDALKPTGANLHLMVDVMLMAVGMVNFRIGQVIGNEALADDTKRFVGNLHYKNLATLILGIYALASAFGADETVLGWVALAVSCAFAARLNDWHQRVLLRQAYVRVNYAVLWALTLGYFGVGMAHAFYPSWYSPARHFLAIGAMLLMILTTMSIAGMRHSGLTLRLYPDTRLALALVLMAGISRSIGVYYAPNAWLLYGIPSLGLVLGFTLYAMRYLTIFHNHRPHD